MASVNEPCCGHDHVGGGELWLTIDEIRDAVRGMVFEMVGADGRLKSPRQLVEEDRRRELEREREDQDQAAEAGREARPGPAQQVGWRERLWG